MVEAWRTHKHELLAALPPGTGMHVFLIFTAPEHPDYTTVCSSVATGIKKLGTAAAKENS